MIIDVAMPGDTKVCDEEQEKIKKYRFLKEQIIANCQIMANEKSHCDSYCSWNIRKYNNNV